MYVYIDICDRVHWKRVTHSSVNTIQLFDINVVTGRGNFFSQEYRICNISARVYDKCPKNDVFKQYNPIYIEQKVIIL
jgi:hypothetical protein